MKLLLIRHGLTQWNVERRIQGHTDTELNEAGRAQIRDWRLPSWCHDAACYSSPFRRARETAEILGLRAVAAPPLREMSWGEWEGLRLADIRRDLGAAMQANEARGLDFRPLAGESPREVQQRALPWLFDLHHDAVVAITHKGVINALYAAASSWDMRAAPPDKLRWHCAHEFEVMDRSRLDINALNLPLVAAE